MTPVYVVIGRVGEYSDSCEWCVRVFRSKSRADTFAAEATVYMAELARDQDFVDRVQYQPLDEADLARLTKYDTTIVYRPDTGPNVGKPFGGRWLYCGEAPVYGVASCGLDEVSP